MAEEYSKGRLMKVRVWGDWACFTRPENKVERVSYPLITPSAAIGLLEAIFWKPQFVWVPEEITVVKSGKFSLLNRNELKKRTTPDAAKNWAKDGGRGRYLIEDERTQRHTLALQNVEYIIKARIALPAGTSDPQNLLAKYQDQFSRRLRRGQSFYQPCLGLREFACGFEFAEGQQAEDWTAGLGTMLLDIDRDTSTPEFFDAEVDAGIMHIPLSKRLRGKLEGQNAAE